jgi:hypothetical protein
VVAVSTLKNKEGFDMQLTDTQIDVFVAFKKLLAESQKK